MGIRLGYGRTSSLEQIAGLEAQERDLWAAGCKKVFVEQLSSVATKRPELDAALRYIREGEGDVFVVKKLDRLARSVFDLLAIVKQLEAKGATLLVLDGAIDTSTPTGRLNLNLLGCIAQFEREIMLERQREGIAKAKRDGKYKGRKPTAREKAGDILAQRKTGVSPTVISKSLNVSIASVYRIFADADEKARLSAHPENLVA